MALRLRRVENRQMTLLDVGELTVLFSYETPVAVNIPGHGWYCTEEFHSMTTAQHISRVTGERQSKSKRRKPQAWFDALLASATVDSPSL